MSPMSEKRHFMAVLPDGREFPFVVTSIPLPASYHGHRWEFEHPLQNVLRTAGVTTSRRSPAPVTIHVDRLTLNDAGERVRTPIKIMHIMPQTAAITDEEYDAEHAELLLQIPEEFRGVVSEYAWEQGHSAGLEEVLCYLKNMIALLKKPLEQYTLRIIAQTQNAKVQN